MNAPMTALPPPELLRRLYAVGVARAQPALVLPPHLPPPPRGRTVVIGAGKASGAMARALEAAWPARAPLSGTVVTRHGHVPGLPAPEAGAAARLPRITVLEGGHPVPDDAGLQATQALVRALDGLTVDDLVIALISGGGSALLTQPLAGWTLQDEQALHRQLLRSGASITEMNTVRRHLSAIKGGRLARRCGPAPLLTLAISDVPGDRLEDIASGPTVADPTTCADALAIATRLGLDLPAFVLSQLRSGELETLKPDDPALARHHARVIATPMDMLQAAAQAAREAGWAAHVLSDRLEGPSHEVGQVMADLAMKARQGQATHAAPCVLLSGGETSVALDARAQREGSGGRCSELLLAASLALQDAADIWMLAADTDGIDGHSNAAGAVIGPGTLARAHALGLDPQAMLRAHDSGRFFAALGDALVPGPTFTNVNDFRAVLISA